MPGTRWRTCESCRALNRTLRQEQKTVVERVRSDGLAFVNMTVNNPDSGPNISASASGSGSSTDIVPIDISTSPGVASTYPLGYTSTSTLLTVNEPPAQAERANSGVRLVRKYKRLPRYDKDPNSTNAEASSSTARKPSASSTSQPPPPAYPYPPHGAFPYYMTPPGYYGMPPPPGSAAPGQPPLMYIPSPYPYPVMPPPSDRSGPPPSRTTPAPPFPYYPYTLPPPGYGMPQHYPRAHYAYPNPMPPAPQIAAGAQPTPYAVYKFHSTPQPAPPPSATPAQGYTYYQFKNGLNNPPEPPPRKRRRVSGETDVATQEQGEEQASRIPLSETPVAVPPADAPRPAEELAQPVTMDVDARDENVPVPAPAVAAQRVCGGKTCNRALVSGAPGPLCEKCRTKMKKRQAMTKQRFRLEPKKITASQERLVNDERERIVLVLEKFDHVVAFVPEIVTFAVTVKNPRFLVVCVGILSGRKKPRIT
ncbi:hypothetical protein DFH09DRAFT_563695 [Mycena vulgaris]|nr:hypothetical protein DFH09DRAFT_563695 [Mycena vulgaris]